MYSLKLALKSIFHKKARAVFTVFSIGIGVTSVLIISIISGMGKTAMNNELDSLGINGLLVSAKSQDGGSVLTVDDLELIEKSEYVKSAVPIVTTSCYASSDMKYQPIIIWGIDSGAQGIISFQLVEGEDFTDSEVATGEYCCLIDERSGNNIGETISVLLNDNTYNLRVKGTVTVDSGIMKSLAGDYIPPIIYLPYTTVQSMTESTHLSQIAVKVGQISDDSVDMVGKDLERNLYSVKDSTDIVSVQNLVQQRNKLNNMLDIISAALSAIGLVSLVVAGLSIMTIMMMSVNERTKEIGIKRAIGAGKWAVMKEILLETVVLCIIGSIVGLQISFAVAFAGNKLFGFDSSISVFSVAATVGCAVIGGVLFGIYPSFVASKLNPVDALRKE